jgi:hypothetical protein
MDSLLLCRVNMPAVVIARGGLMTIESEPADGAHYRAWNFAVQLLATSPLGAHFCTSFAILPVLLKGAVRDLRQEVFPVRLETSAGLVECCRRPGTVLSWMKARVKTAVPMPLVNVDGDAGSLADRSDADIAVTDVPGLLVRVVGAAASEALRQVACGSSDASGVPPS